MVKNNEKFHLEFNRWLTEVEIVDLSKGLFHVHFLNEVPDLTLKKTTNEKGEILWHSINGEMEDIAAGLGQSIDHFLSTSK